MSKNNYDDNNLNNGEEIKGQSKYVLNKFEFDLYHDEDNIPGNVVHVKRIGNAKKGEKWKIFENNKLALTIDGLKLTSKERNFLYSAEGIVFLMNQFKAGVNTVSALKKNMKSLIKT